MSPSLVDRDAAALAGVSKLRFFPLAVTGGSGCWLIEEGGRRLLDLSASWTAAGMGYAHPRIVAAVDQAMRNPGGTSGLSSVNHHMVELAETLRTLTPLAVAEQDRRVYLGNGGTDANDVALRASRHATGRQRILAFEGGYHGGLGVAMGVSGVHVAAGALPEPDSTLLPYPRTAADVATSIEALDAAIAGNDVACLILEAIQSDGGIIVPPPGFLADVVTRARRAGVVVIVDEVKVGLGRTGMLHAFEHDGVTPDLVTFGKALGGGLPLSAAVGPSSVLDSATSSSLLTTSGNPVCAAAGLAVLQTIEDEGLVRHAAASGARLASALRAHPVAGQGEVRGRGLALGVEVIDPKTGQPAPALARKVVYRAWQLGAVVYYVGGHVLEVTPALVIHDSEVDLAVDLLQRAIATADEVTDSQVSAFGGW